LALASALIALGGCSSSAVTSSSSSPAPAGVSGVAVRNCLKELACYTPQQFRVAYGIQPLLDRGIDGRGETVVLLEQEVTTHAVSAATFDEHEDDTITEHHLVNVLSPSCSSW
jgi:subtilase family serine protease